MRLMTIFELAAKTSAELEVLRRTASEAAGNPTLPDDQRREAALTLTNILRMRRHPLVPYRSRNDDGQLRDKRDDTHMGTIEKQSARPLFALM